jgi:flagellar protein FlaG
MSVQQIGDSSLAWNTTQTRVGNAANSDQPKNSDTTSVAASDTASSTDASQTTDNLTATDQVHKSQASTAADSKKELEDTQQAAQALQEFVLPFSNGLSFGVDQDTGTTVVKVIDKSTGDVIKQIPSEEAIELAKALDKLKGLFVQQKA